MPDRPLFWGGANVPPPIRLTICGKDSGEIDKPALGKCQKISIGGWENSNRDIVFSFDLCIKHKGVYLTKHTNSTVLTDEMKVMLKQVSAGDSVIVKNVKYKERYKGIVTLPAISLLVVNKETAIKKTATDSLKIKQ